jgi:hypothetical protein
MNNGLKTVMIVGIVLAVLFIPVAIVIGMFMDTYNTAISYETGINRVYKDAQNVLSSHSNKIAEAAQVPGMARDDLAKVIKEAIGGRYGENGSQATWQWIKEQNPQVDPALYRNLQTMIEAGRNKYENSQRMVLDQCAEYENYRGYLVSGFMLRIMGFPKIQNIDKVCTPIVSGYTQKAYETGVEDGVKLR